MLLKCASISWIHIGEWVNVWVVFFILNQPYCFQIVLTTVPHDKYNCKHCQNCNQHLLSTLVVTSFIAHLFCQFLSFFLSKSRTFLFSLHHISLLHLVSTKKTIRQYSLLEVGEFTNRSKKATWRSTKQQNKILRGE